MYMLGMFGGQNPDSWSSNLSEKWSVQWFAIATCVPIHDQFAALSIVKVGIPQGLGFENRKRSSEDNTTPGPWLVNASNFSKAIMNHPYFHGLYPPFLVKWYKRWNHIALLTLQALVRHSQTIFNTDIENDKIQTIVRYDLFEIWWTNENLCFSRFRYPVYHWFSHPKLPTT